MAHNSSAGRSVGRWEEEKQQQHKIDSVGDLCRPKMKKKKTTGWVTGSYIIEATEEEGKTDDEEKKIRSI